MKIFHTNYAYKALSITALLCVMTGPSADFSHGIAAYKEGDFAKAAVEFFIAAEKGNGLAQLNLGLLYDQGQDVEQSYVEAAKWYQRAAENANVIAQTNLAAMYFQGLGVEQNDELAANWYEKAARAGHPLAQYNLAVLYDEGIGVLPDPVQAYAWLEIAVANGAEASDAERKKLSSRLTDQQREDAKAIIDVYGINPPKQGADN